MARQLSREAWYGEDFAHCYSSEDSCLNLTRQIGPDQMICRLKSNISSGDSCLNLTREDWTRTDDLKTQEEYQKPVMMVDFCPDLCKPVDLKTQSEEFVQVSSPDWEKPVMMGEFCPDQTR
ncbi:hypothetical protein Bbelb_190530 [Branchiostoma belcheri]|nr:hypothetical protein Bbelb_190530 [Branchiostoma belcheri]